MSKELNSLFVRIERAGGAMSEGVKFAENAPELPPPLVNALVDVNIAIGDARRAAVRIEQGEDADVVTRELREQQRELFNA